MDEHNKGSISDEELQRELYEKRGEKFFLKSNGRFHGSAGGGRGFLT